MRLFRRRKPRTIAFVLSGGGNYGALQVGALQVLLEAGIRLDHGRLPFRDFDHATPAGAPG